MKKKVHIFMFIDALGWEIVNRHHFMEEQLPYRYPAKMQFGYSSTAIPTIMTGQPPKVHKHLSFYYYAPEKSPFKLFRYLLLKYLPSKIFDRWRVRHILSKIIAKLYGFTGYFEMYAMPYDRLPYFDYIEKQDIFIPAGLAPVENLADVLEKSKIPYLISNWRSSETENIEQLESELEKGEIEFAFLYTAKLDGLLHMKVDNPEIIQEKLDWYAQHIERLIFAANEHYEHFTLSIMSDHGMTPRTGTVDVKKAIEELDLKFGDDYAAVYDSTLARFWFITEKSRKLIMPILQTIPQSHLLSKEEKEKYGIDFDDDMYGEEILLMDPGIQIEPCDMGIKSLPGMHGFAPEDKHSFASFLSTAPVEIPPTWVGDYFKIMKSRIEELKNMEMPPE
jgi:hypothetical protein